MSNAETKSAPVPMNQEQYSNAVAKGLEVIASGGSKADAARAIYEMLLDEIIEDKFDEKESVEDSVSGTHQVTAHGKQQMV